MEAKNRLPVGLSPGWCVVQFGNVVRNVRVTEREPLAAGLERYVGLEHLDPESLHIQRWGLVAEGTTFTKKFIRGQVLFGKRRAYQRKVAVAEFDGVCSGDLLVFEPCDDRLLSELLPFIAQSENFFAHALRTSAGSLSPRTRWKDLAAYEFPLPPLAEQHRIAEILWATDEAEQLHTNALNAADKARDALIEHVMKRGLNGEQLENQQGITCPRNWQVMRLEDVAIVERGRFAHRPRNLPRFYGGPYPFVQTGDIASSKGTLRNYEQTLSEEGKALSRSFKPPSILITIAAVIGKTAVTTFEVWCPDSIVGIVPGSAIDVNFLEFYLRTVQHRLESKAATQTAQKNINLAVLRPLPVPIPPLEEQRAITALIASFQERIEFLERHISRVRELRSSLLNHLLKSF